MASITTHKSNGDKAGESPKILCEMLRYLGHQERRPWYQGFKELVNDREEWRVEVLIDTKKPNKPLIIEAACRRATFYAGIRDAACQAIYRLRDMYADDLSNTPYHYFPRRRICNTDKEIHCYKKHHHQQHDVVLIQQIRFTEVLVAVCDDAMGELRESQCKVRELEEELRKARRHKHKEEAIDASSPPPQRRVIVGDKKPYQSPGHKAAVTAAAPAPRTRTGFVVGGNTNRRACLSLQRKPAPTRSQRGAAPAPCDRRLAGGVGKEDSVPSFRGGGSGAHQLLPQGQGDGFAPIASTPKSFLMHPVPVTVTVECPRRDGESSSSSPYFESRIHGGSNLMAVAVEGPRRDGASNFERRIHGKNLMAIIIDGGVDLAGKESAANANNSDDAAFLNFWENMEKPCRCSSAARRRRLL